jgi:prepilin peptidase CpaA
VIQTLADVILTCLLCTAAWCDYHSHRIPNWLSLAGLAAALTLRAPLGPESWLQGVGGFGVALAVAVLLYALGAVGGGDTKLLAVVGAFMGLDNLPGALAYIVLFGGAVAVLSMARQGLLPLLLLYTLDLMKSWRSVARSGQVRTLRSPGALTIPYAIPIAMGALFWWFGQGVRL